MLQDALTNLLHEQQPEGSKRKFWNWNACLGQTGESNHSIKYQRKVNRKQSAYCIEWYFPRPLTLRKFPNCGLDRIRGSLIPPTTGTFWFYIVFSVRPDQPAIFSPRQARDGCHSLSKKQQPHKDFLLQLCILSGKVTLQATLFSHLLLSLFVYST